LRTESAIRFRKRLLERDRTRDACPWREIREGSPGSEFQDERVREREGGGAITQRIPKLRGCALFFFSLFFSFYQAPRCVVSSNQTASLARQVSDSVAFCVTSPNKPTVRCKIGSLSLSFSLSLLLLPLGRRKMAAYRRIGTPSRDVESSESSEDISRLKN